MAYIALAIRDNIENGSIVRFDTQAGPKGPQASNVIAI